MTRRPILPEAVSDHVAGYKCPLPTCGNVSSLAWRCDECGKLFEGNEERVSGEFDPSVGG